MKRIKKAISNLLFECEGITEERYRYCLTCGDVDVLQEFIEDDKTAEQMFLELGYELSSKDGESIIYRYKKNKHCVIEFDLVDRKIIPHFDDDNSLSFITSKELPAVIKQTEELGW